ncbi:MAG: glycosyl transferase family 2 [uncultured bacterium (gcode 4)]|uniref:Glycosyl transferase family 2 n=1 Tax=uncultured bacterium (gcode 4) TaxID=1234023 RepID=K1XWL7_9BACT|nr:MAG: glycosyl transferase family 2 [uncultured bacterium (gcode 4)]
MKISIITPSYNQAEFIERTILSVITQKWDFELEYIIMDGGSTDNTIKIIQNLEFRIQNWKIKTHCKKINFIWRSEKDKGQSDAINKWLKLATWDIVTYLNSDDTYEPGALAHVVKYLWRSDKMRCYGKCRIIDTQDKEIRKWITWYKNLLWGKYSYAKLLSENFISQMTVFWKKEVMGELGYFDINEHLCMDYEYRLRIGAKYAPVYIPQYLSNFRFYQTSKSWSRFVNQFTDELRIARKYARGGHKWALFLHRINYYKIVMAYKILHLFKI